MYVFEEEKGIDWVNHPDKFVPNASEPLIKYMGNDYYIPGPRATDLGWGVLRTGATGERD